MGLPTDDLNSVFWLSIAGILSAMLSICLKSLYKSKCSEFSCCGVTIKRDIASEVKEDIELANHRGSLDEPPSPAPPTVATVRR